MLLQIEPREVEIGEMKETIRAMDSELERYHKSNAGLDLTIQVRQHVTVTCAWSIPALLSRFGQRLAQAHVSSAAEAAADTHCYSFCLHRRAARCPCLCALSLD
jgi:hypothetical protein